MSDLDKQALGKGGATYEKGTTARSAGYCAIELLADTVFAALDWPELDGDSLIGDTLPKGLILRGDIKGFTLTSGSVVAYKSNV